MTIENLHSFLAIGREVESINTEKYEMN